MKKFLAAILAVLGVAAASIGLAEESAMEAGTPLSLTSRALFSAKPRRGASSLRKTPMKGVRSPASIRS